MIVGKRQIFFLFVLIFWVNAAEAQRNKSQLQKEKQQNLEKIKETEKILAETGQQKKNSLGTLSALMQRVNQQEALILSIQSEIELMNMDIGENNEILRALQADL